MRITSLVILCIAIFPQSAVAQSGEVRCPAPKTQLKNSIGGTAESLGNAGAFVCRFKNLATGKKDERILGAFDFAAPDVQANLDKFRSLIPLQVGKRMSYAYSGASNLGGSGDWSYTISIEKYETITIPVGTFPSFVILQVEQTHASGGRWERRWWYSPLLGHIIKFEFKTVQGNPPPNYPRNWELIEIRTP